MKGSRGRPRLYRNGTELMSLRVPAGMWTLIRSAIAQLRLQPGGRNVPAATFLLEGLKRQIRSLENQDVRAQEALQRIERREVELMRPPTADAKHQMSDVGADASPAVP